MEWEEETDAYLCGCVSFYWNIEPGDSAWDCVIGDYEEAGTHLAEAPAHDSPPAPD